MILFYGFYQLSLGSNNLGDVISIYDFINRRFHYITPDIRVIETFKNRGGFVEFAHFNKYAIKRQEEKASQRSRFDFFLPDALKTTF